MHWCALASLNHKPGSNYCPDILSFPFFLTNSQEFFVVTFDPKFRPVILFFSKDGDKTQRLHSESLKERMRMWKRICFYQPGKNRYLPLGNATGSTDGKAPATSAVAGRRSRRRICIEPVASSIPRRLSRHRAARRAPSISPAARGTIPGEKDDAPLVDRDYICK